MADYGALRRQLDQSALRSTLHALYAPRALRAPFAVFFVVFLVLRLMTVLERLAADLLALLPADLLTAFRVGFLPVLLAVRFGATRFLFRAGAAANGGTIMGSVTRPSAASGM